MRVGAHEAPLPFQDHAVLVIERRILDRDGDLAGRQPRLVDAFEVRHDLAALLMEDESAEITHYQLLTSAPDLCTNTSLPGPVPGIHVFEANSLKGQSSICLTGFDPKQ